MLNRAIILSQADFKYSLIMLIVLFVNILLCGYTLILQKIVLLLSIMILNFCKIEYDRQNILIKDYQENMMIIESDNDSDDDSDDNYEDEKKTISV